MITKITLLLLGWYMLVFIALLVYRVWKDRKRLAVISCVYRGVIGRYRYNRGTQGFVGYVYYKGHTYGFTGQNALNARLNFEIKVNELLDGF